MLSTPHRGRHRPPRSLRSEYDQFIEQRIEEYKDSLPRADILSIGDEAVAELADGDQLALTEVVLRDQVDSIIRRRLKLPSFRRWRERHVALRAAQSEPGHWGLTAHEPVVALADVLEDQDPVLILGAGEGACALFLAARGASVRVADQDLTAVLALENRAVREQLGALIECVVVQLDRFVPDGGFAAAVLETQALAGLPAGERAALVARMKAATPEGGWHAVMPGAVDLGGDDARLSSDALVTLYGDWQVSRVPASGPQRRGRNTGFSAVRPTVSE